MTSSFERQLTELRNRYQVLEANYDMLREADEQCEPEELEEIFARCRHIVNEWQRIVHARNAKGA